MRYAIDAPFRQVNWLFSSRIIFITLQRRTIIIIDGVRNMLIQNGDYLPPRYLLAPLPIDIIVAKYAIIFFISNCC
jgi:hypothetical protein